MNHGFLQLLKCFGAGLGAIIAVIGALVGIVFILERGKKLENRIALWFAHHPRLLKTLQVIGISALAISLTVIITAWGCDILGVK